MPHQTRAGNDWKQEQQHNELDFQVRLEWIKNQPGQNHASHSRQVSEEE